MSESEKLSFYGFPIFERYGSARMRTVRSYAAARAHPHTYTPVPPRFYMHLRSEFCEKQLKKETKCIMLPMLRIQPVQKRTGEKRLDMKGLHFLQNRTQSARLLTEGKPWKVLVSFAMPIFLSQLFQQLYNTADALIVGRMLGNDALAAVSATGNLSYLLISFFMGIAAGSGVLISRYYDARDTEKLRLAVRTNLAFSFASGVLMTLVGVTLTPTILRWMDTPADVMDLAVTYTRILFGGSLGLVLYNSLRGVMQAVGDSTHPLWYLIFSSLLNVVLDIAFIAVFHTGVGGAALATVLAQFLSGLLCLRRLARTEEAYRVRLRELCFDPTMLRLMLSLSRPTIWRSSLTVPCSTKWSGSPRRVMWGW